MSPRDVGVNRKSRVGEFTIVFRASVTLGYAVPRESTVPRWTVMERDTSSSQSCMSGDAFLTSRYEANGRLCVLVRARTAVIIRRRESTWWRLCYPSSGVSATRAILHGGKVTSLVKGDVATLTSPAVDAPQVRYRKTRKRRRYNLGKYGAFPSLGFRRSCRAAPEEY